MNIRAAACLAVLVPIAASAAPDIEQGRKLVQEKKCESCHQQKVQGPVGAIYLRQDRRVTSWAKLQAQVAACNTMLNAGLFPEDEENIAAYLNQTYYKFPTK
jgi:cytochrome c2